MLEYQILNRMVRVGLKYIKKVTVSVTNIASTKAEPSCEIDKDMYAPTLLARDFKGFSNYGSPACLIIKEEENE